MDMVTLFVNYSDSKPLFVANGNGEQIELANERAVRKFVQNTLTDISVGYFKMHNIPVMAPIISTPAPSAGALAAPCSEDAAVVDAACTVTAVTADTEAEHVSSLSPAVAFQLMSWIRDNIHQPLTLQPSYRSCMNHIGDSFGSGPVGSLTHTDVMSAIVECVCEHIKPPWVHEISNAPNSGLFMEKSDDVMMFLKFRHLYITNLWKTFCCGDGRITANDGSAMHAALTDSPAKVELLQTTDPNQESTEDVLTYWRTALDWANTAVDTKGDDTLDSLEAVLVEITDVL